MSKTPALLSKEGRVVPFFYGKAQPRWFSLFGKTNQQGVAASRQLGNTEFYEIELDGDSVVGSDVTGPKRFAGMDRELITKNGNLGKRLAATLKRISSRLDQVTLTSTSIPVNASATPT